MNQVPEVLPKDAHNAALVSNVHPLDWQNPQPAPKYNLVGIGRTPNVENLNLEAVGVKFDKKEGVHVNDQLRTTSPRIYAAGDICLKYKFTHTADAAARMVIQNALFLGRKKLSALTIPWCTYTDPEIAHVGGFTRGMQGRKESGLRRS